MSPASLQVILSFTHVTISVAIRGFAKTFFFKKSEITMEVGVGKSSQNSLKPVLIFWSSIPCVFCLNTLLKVVGYYDCKPLSHLIIC